MLDSSLIVVGGARHGFYTSAVWKISLPEVSPVALAGMGEARSNHGIIAIGGSVLVFGGFNGAYLDSAESMTENEWYRI